ncbi:hypothetical protein HU200_013441 [Digitaria exilis]|uniref:Uncharacterized protein n=1 Tax=Digitaria exilis TaxID=1010633 RepID=A0A835FDW8_9POAL|nr:hypothetical protein HU200_013441 [Digitaria exilis]
MFAYWATDLEEDAVKRSAEEQQQRTAIDTHDTDIALVRAQAKQAREEAEQLVTARAQVCMDLAENQGRIATLDVECATLKQVMAINCCISNFISTLTPLETLELLHQEIASTSAKLNEKRLFYTKTAETLAVKLQEQQEWLGSLKTNSTTMEPHVATTQSKQTFIEGESHGTYSSEGSLDMVKQILEPEKNIFAGFPMDMKSLGEEYKALQGDKAGEIEYFHSLEETIIGMKVWGGIQLHSSTLLSDFSRSPVPDSLHPGNHAAATRPPPLPGRQHRLLLLLRRQGIAHRLLPLLRREALLAASSRSSAYEALLVPSSYFSRLRRARSGAAMAREIPGSGDTQKSRGMAAGPKT